MHEYIATHHDRKIAYYIIATLSGVLALLIGLGIKNFHALTGILITGPSGLALYGLFFILFDKYLWKHLQKAGLIEIPNLNGTWRADILSSASTQKVSANVKINQTYTKISIHLSTNKSDSHSQMATIDMASPDIFKLRYEYNAEFKRDEAAIILRHYGVTSLTIELQNKKLADQHSANYYTEQGRDSHGNMQFYKVK